MDLDICYSTAVRPSNAGSRAPPASCFSSSRENEGPRQSSPAHQSCLSWRARTDMATMQQGFASSSSASTSHRTSTLLIEQGDGVSRLPSNHFDQTALDLQHAQGRTCISGRGRHASLILLLSVHPYRLMTPRSRKNLIWPSQCLPHQPNRAA